MNGRTHLLLGVVFGILYLHMFPISDLFTKIIFAAFLISGAVLPDIDHPESPLGKKHKLISALSKHRGMWHSIFPLLLIYFLAIIFPRFEIPLLGLFIGYLSHLVGDALTIQGVSLFYPLSKGKFRGPIKTGSWSESFIVLLIVVYFLIK